MQLLQNYCKNFCKILQENALLLTNSCKICLNLVKFLQNHTTLAKLLQELYSVWTNLGDNVFVITLKESDTYVTKFRVLLCKNIMEILQSIQDQAFRVGSEIDNNEFIQTDEINCFFLYFYSNKFSHCKTYDFRKFLIPDAFKHVRLKNTFSKCKVHQILPLTVDYACFLVKCINYQNVMCLKMIHFLQDLTRFLQKIYFLQETQLLQNF